MIKRMLAVVLATTALALLLAAAVPRPAGAAVSFVDKQVQAGSLLIQKYVDDYAVDHQFVVPTKAMVKKGGGLPDSTAIWPSNPWTGKIMAPGTSRGTYTYAPAANGLSYKLIVHLSKGPWPLTGGMPPWFRSERNTASRQNLLLLQRYIEAYAMAHGGTYPAPADVTAATFGASYVWPKNPWTGAEMAGGDALGCYRYTGGGASYALKVMLTTGWSTAFTPLLVGQLTATPGG